MTSTLTLEECIKTFFKPLQESDEIPDISSLSTQLNTLVQEADRRDTIRIDQKTASLYATAAVEMWLRGVHSFLISASLTEGSPIWASVSGYYASHYCVRGFAHLLGIFQLYQKRKVLKIYTSAGKWYCQILKKGANDREHVFYWKAVKGNARFAGDPFFTTNSDRIDESDSSHRSRANYADHIDKFPTFQPLNEEDVKRRIKVLSEVALSTAPIPDRKKYPDVEAVQLVAYHRLIRFRRFLDDVLGDTHKFWNVHRTPSWCKDFLDFQFIEPKLGEA